MYRLTLPVLLVAMLTTLSSQAQTVATRTIRIGLSLSGNAYVGNLGGVGSAGLRVNAGGDLSLEQVNGRPLGFSFQAGFGKFTAQTDPGGSLDLARFVETPFLHGDFRAHLRARNRKSWQPYASLGAGLISFSPRDKDGNLLNQGDYNTLIPQFPISGGMRWEINQLVALDLSYTWRFTPTDFLDNTSSQPASRNSFDALHAIRLGLQVDIDRPLKEGGSAPPASTSPAPPIVQQTPSAPQPTAPESEVVEPTVQPSYDLAAIQAAIEEERLLYYVTKSGDTMEALATEFQVPEDIILELNFLSSSKLKKGMYLRIPDLRTP